MIKITITTANAAFEDGARAEAARILRKLADDMEGFRLDYDQWVLLDANGNHVGRCLIEDDRDEGRDTTSEDGEEDE